MNSLPSYRTLPLRAAKLWDRVALLTRPAKSTEPDQWAAANRTHPLSSGLPGPRDPHLTPYIIEPERMVASCVYKRVILMTGAQSAKTEMLLDLAGHRL